MPVSTFPTIAYMLEPIEGAACPHCGCAGRNIYPFMTTDGRRLAAMAGCLKLFPKHRFAERHAAILQKHVAKVRAAARRGDNSPNLPGWDQNIVAAIESVARGEVSEQHVVGTIAVEDGKKREWLHRNGLGRRR